MVVPQLHTSPQLKTVSLFAGCGGFDLGFRGDFTYRDLYHAPLPFNILQAYEIDPKAVATYRQNFAIPAETCDLALVPATELVAADVLLGGFPCQDFSAAGKRRGLTSTRGQLYQVMVRYMEVHQPQVVIAENVVNLARMGRGQVLYTILEELEQVGYRFVVWRLYAPLYGVPQRRERLFLIGVRNDRYIQPMLPLPSHPSPRSYRTIEWAIQDLEQVTDERVPNQSQYFRALRATGGDGQGDFTEQRHKPARTICANSKSRINFHYALERRLTVREVTRIQTFPDTFVFPHAATENVRQIGNAVPPLLAYRIAQSVADYLIAQPVGREWIEKEAVYGAAQT